MVAPPFVSLHAAVEELEESGIRVFAQNVHWAEEGAFTGEVSRSMLIASGVAGAIVGHSERRQYFGETDETAARRAAAALEAGLGVIACVGETLEEREEGETEDVLRRQVGALAEAIPEPTRRSASPTSRSGRSAPARPRRPSMAREAHALIKSIYPVERVLYGGSVKPENADELLSQEDVDGALVGGASLEVDSFTAICETAARLTRS